MTKMANPKDYGRFWAVFNRLTIRGDREECRRQIVSQYTRGRTDSLKDMTAQEYAACIAGMEAQSGSVEALKKWRSSCLRLMQQLGIDTTDWSAVDAFCLDPRIAGKRFAWLDHHELEDLQRKLRAIRGKGGLRGRDRPQGGDTAGMLIIPGRRFDA